MKPIDPDPLNLSVSDVAELCGIGAMTVRRLADAGKIKCVRIPSVTGKRDAIRKFRRSWVTEFLDRHTVTVAAEPVGGPS